MGKFDDNLLSIAEVVAYRRAMGHSCTRSAVQQALKSGSLTGTLRAGRWFVHADDLHKWLVLKAEPIRAAQQGLAVRHPAAGAPDHEVMP